METLRVAAIQAGAEVCLSEQHFRDKICALVKKAKDQGAKIAVFPEDVGFWLTFANETYRVQQLRAGRVFEKLSTTTGWRKWVEDASDWILNRLHFNWFGEWLAQDRIARIVARTFSYAAKQYGIVIVSGTCYVRRKDGLYGACWVYDTDGKLAGEYLKHTLVPVETAWGIKPGKVIQVIDTRDYRLGVCICFDLNTVDAVHTLALQGAQLIAAPSGGWRPYPGYPFDASDMPQIQRAKEVSLAVVRPYSCGWMAPGLYFDGHTTIVSPTGLINASAPSTILESIVVADIPIPHKS